MHALLTVPARHPSATSCIPSFQLSRYTDDKASVDVGGEWQSWDVKAGRLAPAYRISEVNKKPAQSGSSFPAGDGEAQRLNVALKRLVRATVRWQGLPSASALNSLGCSPSCDQQGGQVEFSRIQDKG